MSLIKQDLISSSKYKVKCPYAMEAEGIAIHNTYNDASAKNEISYMKNNNNQVSYHVAVDDIEAIQAIPFNRNAWACGDGSNGKGNRRYISIEICYSKSGGTKFANAEKKASKVVAEILKSKGWGIDKVKAHRDFANKNCPHRTSMTTFKKMVEAELKALNNTNTNTVKKYDHCILYSGEIDKSVATCMGFYYTDCIVKDVKDHIKWEGRNLYVVGGACNNFTSEEKFTKIQGSNRKETHEAMLKFINR